MEIEKLGVRFHSITVHFTVALFPVAIFFLILYLLFHQDSFRHTYFSLTILATLSIPFSYLTGIVVWKKRYRGVKTHIFVDKIRYGLILPVVGVLCSVWYWLNPDVLDDRGLLIIIFLILNLSTLPITLYLGHLGGKLAFKVPH
jgi:uncharacterized membrane protein